MGNEVQGVDIEIIEKVKTEDPHIVVPNTVVINGQEVLIPSGSRITIGEISDDDAVTVTVTMFVRSLSIRQEGGVVKWRPDAA